MSFIYACISFGFMVAACTEQGHNPGTIVLCGTFFLASLIQDVKERLK